MLDSTRIEDLARRLAAGIPEALGRAGAIWRATSRPSCRARWGASI